MSKNNTKTARKVVSLILSFLIFLSISMSFLCIDLWMGFCSENNVTNSFNRTDYQGKAYRQLEDDVISLMNSQGMPPRVATSVINEKRFNVDSGNCYKSAMNGKSELVDTTSMEADLNDNIEKYFEKKNVKINEVLRTSINETVNTAAKYYKEHASFKFGKYFVEYKNDMENKIKILIPVSLAFALICALVLLKIHKYKHRAVRYMVYALSGASVLNLLVGAVLFIVKPFGIDAASDYYRAFAKMFVFDSLIPCFVVGGIGFIISLIAIDLIKRSKHSITKV